MKYNDTVFRPTSDHSWWNTNGLGALKWGRLLILLAPLLLSSCYTTKKVNYLQSNKSILRIPVIKTKYLVQPNDVLNIKVQSRDPEEAAFFNSTALQNRNGETNPASLFLSGYTVDQKGMINLAMVGELEVAGLTVQEIRSLVQREVDKYLVNAKVMVQLTSFKVSVLGDVKNPGTNYIYNSESTIFEALGTAGDLNISANRKTVRLIRQVDDKSVVVTLDLTDPMVIQSPYYFLHPNDVIYVETSKQNIVRNNFSVATLVLTAISTGLLIWNLAAN